MPCIDTVAQVELHTIASDSEPETLAFHMIPSAPSAGFNITMVQGHSLWQWHAVGVPSPNHDRARPYKYACIGRYVPGCKVVLNV